MKLNAFTLDKGLLRNIKSRLALIRFIPWKGAIARPVRHSHTLFPKGNSGIPRQLSKKTGAHSIRCVPRFEQACGQGLSIKRLDVTGKNARVTRKESCAMLKLALVNTLADLVRVLLDTRTEANHSRILVNIVLDPVLVGCPRDAGRLRHRETNAIGREHPAIDARLSQLQTCLKEVQTW